MNRADLPDPADPEAFINALRRLHAPVTFSNRLGTYVLYTDVEIMVFCLGFTMALDPNRVRP